MIPTQNIEKCPKCEVDLKENQCPTCKLYWQMCELPVDLLSDSGDALYFGVDDLQPFSNLIFDTG